MPRTSRSASSAEEALKADSANVNWLGVSAWAGPSCPSTEQIQLKQFSIAKLFLLAVGFVNRKNLGKIGHADLVFWRFFSQAKERWNILFIFLVDSG